jgi:hypothetical protein
LLNDTHRTITVHDWVRTEELKKRSRCSNSSIVSRCVCIRIGKIEHTFVKNNCANLNLQVLIILLMHEYMYVGRISSVGIATGYLLDGQGIEFLRGRDFPRPSRPALGPTEPPV